MTPQPTPFKPRPGRTHIIGIDPGLSGAVAIYNADPFIDPKDAVQVFDLPTYTVQRRGTKTRAHFHVEHLAPLIGMHCDKAACAIIEKVGAAPGSGTASMFRFGEGYGILQGILAAWGVPTFLATPTVWKTRAGLLGADKLASIAEAQRLFPHLPKETFFGPRGGKRDGRAEAILLTQVIRL